MTLQSLMTGIEPKASDRKKFPCLHHGQRCKMLRKRGGEAEVEFLGSGRVAWVPFGEVEFERRCKAAYAS